MAVTPKTTQKGVMEPAEVFEAATFQKQGAGTLRTVVFYTNKTGHKMRVMQIVERHGTAEATAGSLTGTIYKVPSGTAPASGTALHGTGINLKGTANTNASPTLSATLSDLKLADGDSLAFVPSAAGTEIADLGVTVLLAPILR